MGFVFPCEVAIGCQGTNNLGKKERNQGFRVSDGWLDGGMKKSNLFIDDGKKKTRFRFTRFDFGGRDGNERSSGKS